MTRLVEFPLESGGVAGVEVADDGGRPVTPGFRDEVVPERVQLTFEQAVTVSLTWRAAAPEPAASPPDQSQGAG